MPAQLRSQTFIRHFIRQRGLLALFIALPLAGCILSTEQQAKRQELRQLAAETPKFPDFEQTDYSDIVKSSKVVVTYFYRSSASYEDVKSFYTKALLSQGWSSPQEERLTKWFDQDGSRRLIFRKGKHTIYINYEADKASSWRFAVDYDWQA